MNYNYHRNDAKEKYSSAILARGEGRMILKYTDRTWSGLSVSTKMIKYIGMQTFFIVGPTAVGKTAVSIELAKQLDAEIISADSMQVYRGMDIGTAKPTIDEQAGIKHHLLNVCNVNESFDVKQFVDLASVALRDIHARGRIALVVGGTGLYVRALRWGLFSGPSSNPGLRQQLEKETAHELFSELKRVDPVTAQHIDRYNKRRLVRALEVYRLTGKSIRGCQTQWCQSVTPEGVIAGVVFERPRDELYYRIEKRIDEQLEAGWIVEVKQLIENGLFENKTALQAAGYRELAAYLRGVAQYDETVKLIKTKTRQLAKRQLTWFRRESGLDFVQLESSELPGKTALRVLNIVERGINK